MKNLLITIATMVLIFTTSFSAQAQDATTATPSSSSSSAGGALNTASGAMSLGLFYDTDNFIYPTFGYFVIPNLELTLGFLYSNDEVDDGDNTDTTSRYGFNFGVNYYIPFRGKLSMVAGGALVYYSTEHENENNGNKQEESTAGINLKFGLIYAFTPNFAMEGGIKIHYLSTDYDNDMDGSEFGIQLGYFGVKGFF
jgi:opacity protein-like surface antigen